MKSQDSNEMTRINLQGVKLSEYIGRKYIDKVIYYIRGESMSIVSSAQFI